MTMNELSPKSKEKQVLEVLDTQYAAFGFVNLIWPLLMV